MHQPTLPTAVGQLAFPDDPDFPQLVTAADPARMLGLFRQHLKPIAGSVSDIRDCTPFRFRCRQSTSRCVLQYTLRLVEPTTGRQWDQWVTGVVYARPGKAERLWREAQATDPRRGIPARWLSFEPVGFIADLDMLVQVFPYDRKLEHLAGVLRGEGVGAVSRALEPLLLARLGPGAWRAGECTLEPTRYRTELGAALRCTLQARDAATGAQRALRCYLKVYRDDHGRESFSLLRSLVALGRGSRPYAAVEPIAYLSELRTLVLEEAAGTPLQQLLLGGGDAVCAARAVARAVAAFNQDSLPVVRSHSLADQLKQLERAATLLQWACPELRAEVAALTDAVARGLAEVPAAPMHRDLKTDHVFLAGSRVIFIDLDSVALGDPVRDPAHLFAHLVARVGMDELSPARARTAATAFVEEYFAHVPAAWRERFPLHAAGALIEVARGIFKRQEPRWPEKVATAVAEARAVLSETVTP